MNCQYIITEIKERVTMFDVAERYGFDLHKKHFIHCPFHAEKTPSMKLYEGNRGYYCFGCGCSGDIFDFVKNVFNINFAESQIKLNNDFGLNLPIGEKLDRRKQMQIAKEQFKKEQEKKERKKQLELLQNAVDVALDDFVRFDKNKMIYKPTKYTTELNPLFVEAIKNYEKAKYNLECAETELYLYQKNA